MEALSDVLRWRSAKLLVGPEDEERDLVGCLLLLLLLLCGLDCSPPPSARARAEGIRGDEEDGAAAAAEVRRALEGDAGGRPWLLVGRLRVAVAAEASGLCCCS